MKSFLLAAAATAALCLSGVAQAQTAYTADQMVKRFMDQKKQQADQGLGQARGLALGNRRGLCVGTEAECASQAAGTRAQPSGIDLVVTFDLDSDQLTPDARRNLDEFVKALVDPRLSNFRFEVGGHTDARGSEAHNQDLSRKRAGAVVAYLQGKGVSVSRLAARAYGESRPRAADRFDPANRRVEAKIME
jgi:OmpA-OmpF porin, OOP family